MLEWLEKWYESQCNGNWEHIFGIKIETIDNPGWSIEIDFEDTELDLETKEWALTGDFESKWLGYKIDSGKFDGSCDPANLSVLISIFKKLTEGLAIDKAEILESLRK